MIVMSHRYKYSASFLSLFESNGIVRIGLSDRVREGSSGDAMVEGYSC